MFTLTHNPSHENFHLEFGPQGSASTPDPLAIRILEQFHLRITAGGSLLDSLSQALSGTLGLSPQENPDWLAAMIMFNAFPESFATTTAAPTPITRTQLTPEQRKLLVDKAMGWLNVPYLWGGNSRQGIDCSHLVYQVHKEAGIDYAFTTTTQDWQKAGFHEVTDPQIGDLILWSPADGNSFGHVGIVIDPENKIFIGAQTPVEKASYATGRYWGRRPYIFLRYGTSE